MGGENAKELKVSATRSFQSVSLGFIPEGGSVTQTFPITLENDLTGSGSLYLDALPKPNWATLKVTYTDLVAASGTVDVTDGKGPTGSGTKTATMADSGLTGGAYGQSFALLTSTGVPWPATQVYVDNPAKPPIPPYIPEFPGVPLPGYRGLSVALPDVGMVREVNTLPYPRSAATGAVYANVLDLDTLKGRKYQLSVEVTVKSGTYNRNNPAANVKEFRLKFAAGSDQWAEWAFGAVIVDKNAKRVGEDPAGLPAHLLARVPK